MGEETEGNAFDKKKSHRNRQAGRKAEKKKAKKSSGNNPDDISERQKNPKAFAFNSAVRAERQFRRKQDLETKKQHIPLVDRTPLEPPPFLVAVVGPPKVGKSTLINNLIKLFTKSPLTEIKGPVTIVTGKKRRITLIECNNDVNAMIDLAKVADLVLLLCDANFGFEMEIFEFLNISQVHGMPRIMGVLTHLDMIKNTKTLKNTKKVLKHRFWTEVYSGAKLFYLSGILHGEYLRNEIRNLGRFISVMKFRPLTWRITHSYLLGDRYEDLTNQEIIRRNPKCDRNISLYGYVRGVPLVKNTSVHIAGLGDLKIHDVSYLPDPCPLPEAIKKRSLIEKEKFIYAPFSGVGGIVYDKDAVYVELGGSHSHNTDSNNSVSKNLVSNLIETKETLDVKMQHSEMQIFSGGQKLTAKDLMERTLESSTIIEDDEEDENGSSDSDLDEELNELRNKKNYLKVQEEKVVDSGRTRRKVVFDQNDEEFEKSIQIDENSSDSDDDNDDDEIDDQNKAQQTKNSEYTSLKQNKDKDVHNKIADTLKYLNTKNNKKVKFDENEITFSQNDDDIKKEFSDDSDWDESESEENSEDEIVGKEIKNKNDLNTETVEEIKDELLSESETSDEEAMDVKWKENLSKKASDAFLDRQRTTHNIMKLVYGVFDKYNLKRDIDNKKEEFDEDGGDIGGLFRLVTNEQRRLNEEKEKLNVQETSLFATWDQDPKDWLHPENKIQIANCFVTGKWKQSEDASELLRLDDMNEFSDDDNNSEIFGDFEDLETGEKHTATETTEKQAQAEKRKRTESETEEKPLNRQELVEKKRKLKEKFDSEYDNNTDGTTFYEELKSSAEKQAQLNKSVFENMPDDLRVQIEGFRPGMYVRVEFQNVPAEFITHFDPTYPLVIGALNIGEENIGFVNVKIKKHRWYKKVLKTTDPLIISMGWRRFQTVPLFSKLEDDLKYRYLKYTPEHVGCNAHFWGPITPQGTGFLALQSCDGNLENIKQLGFRIAATGSVQELGQSTQIMKKLKLIGYPMKIYKKTAFIKDMFNSTLEVAKFEGASIKTVSGIRGQIKKAVSKPEGCFRATFEDKILLSDIVFCRTWYKVNVPKFYNPVTNLLLSFEKKNAWQGARTTGQLKREKDIKNEPNYDSLYTEIKRESKPFKPLVIPRKLQRQLPYRDKPKYAPLKSDRKPDVGKKRVAVIREPREQKVAEMLKMLRTSYEHKQEQLKVAMSERMKEHQSEMKAQEEKKLGREKRERKEIFRKRSKTKIRNEKKGRK